MHSPPPRHQGSRQLNDESRAGLPGAYSQHAKFLRDLRVFVLPALIAVLVIVAFYGLVTFWGGSDAVRTNSAKITASLSAVPIVSSLMLMAFRRSEAPLTVAFLVTTSVFSLAVMILSALRLPMSYAGVALTFPFVVAAMVTANIWFHSALTQRVALLSFPGAANVKQLLGENVAVVDRPDTPTEPFDIVLIDPNRLEADEWNEFFERCYLAGTEVMSWTRYLEIRLGRVDIDSFSVSDVIYGPDQILYARLKRLLDIILILFSLPLTVPIVLVAMCWILLCDPGPVLFVQHRRGLGGRPFRIYKLRTMYRGVAGGATKRRDHRIIAGCRLIRKLRIDELPQLFNVLRGDMSLIGPRPEALDLAKWYEKEIPEYRFRLMVLPGISGWAQVHSGYTSNPEEAKTKLSYDLYYIKHLSLDIDLQILFKTFRTIVLASGAR